MILLSSDIYIPDVIASLEFGLAENKNLSPVDRASMREDLTEYKHIWELWQSFQDVRLNPATDRLESDWHEFPMGTPMETVWHWFEEHFNLKVTGNLIERDSAYHIEDQED